MINPDLWEKAKIFSDTIKGENVSSIIRKALENYIEKESKNNLAYRMRTNIKEYVDEKEKKEILKILSNLTDEDLKTGEIIEL